MSGSKDAAFLKRREATVEQINALDKDELQTNPNRDVFFDAVYKNADGDAALVPWADLEPKKELREWLSAHVPLSGKAIDIGCGLGDNAECIANTGMKTTGFDFSAKAIDWAKKRFPNSAVSYRQADLFDLPREWIGAFDLVHECYTLQAMPPVTLEKSIPAVASLVAPGGTLLVYTRIRENGSAVNGPPWPLEERTARAFANFDLTLTERKDFTIERPGRLVPVTWWEWQKT